MSNVIKKCVKCERTHKVDNGTYCPITTKFYQSAIFILTTNMFEDFL